MAQDSEVLSAVPVLAENAHPLNEKPIGINSHLELLPESEELVWVSAAEAVPW